MNALEKIGLTGLVPVVVINEAEDAVPAAKALLKGGLDIMEITKMWLRVVRRCWLVPAQC